MTGTVSVTVIYTLFILPRWSTVDYRYDLHVSSRFRLLQGGFMPKPPSGSLYVMEV